MSNTVFALGIILLTMTVLDPAVHSAEVAAWFMSVLFCLAVVIDVYHFSKDNNEKSN